MQITVDFHFEDGTWYALSDQLPGYSASADTLAALRRKVREGVSLLLGASASVVEHFGPGAVFIDAPQGLVPVGYPAPPTTANPATVTSRPSRVRLRLEPQHPSGAVA
ncbi:MAG: DUF1902 domain-containing protein [Kineosporiaceae bacterium]